MADCAKSSGAAPGGGCAEKPERRFGGLRLRLRLLLLLLLLGLRLRRDRSRERLRRRGLRSLSRLRGGLRLRRLPRSSPRPRPPLPASRKTFSVSSSACRTIVGSGGSSPTLVFEPTSQPQRFRLSRIWFATGGGASRTSGPLLEVSARRKSPSCAGLGISLLLSFFRRKPHSSSRSAPSDVRGLAMALCRRCCCCCCSVDWAEAPRRLGNAGGVSSASQTVVVRSAHTLLAHATCTELWQATKLVFTATLAQLHALASNSRRSSKASAKRRAAADGLPEANAGQSVQQGQILRLRDDIQRSCWRQNTGPRG